MGLFFDTDLAVSQATAQAHRGDFNMETIRTETTDGVRSIILCRAKEYNTITPQLRDELAQAIDSADTDHDVHVILLRAEGPAFCAGYSLDWSTAAQA
ncbi:MAG: enoyl-CoA hydratase/isomerase family protein, partial [Micromonosporaceae bacterium]